MLKVLLRSNFIFGPTIDGSIVPASPAQLISEGKFLKYPFISGNNQDECVSSLTLVAKPTADSLACRGTIFYPPQANTSAAFAQVVKLDLPNPPNQTVISTLLSYYSDYTQGSPFGTGNETFGFGPQCVQDLPSSVRRSDKRFCPAGSRSAPPSSATSTSRLLAASSSPVPNSTA